MQTGPPQAVARPTRVADDAAAPRQRRTSRRASLTETVPDEPIAVLAVGAGAGRGEVLGALLRTPAAAIDRPAATYLVISHGYNREIRAYVPGNRQAQPFRAMAAAEPPAVRPPRRIEFSLPDPLLRHFALVDTPDVATLGVAGQRVLIDAAQRGGAVLYVVTADSPVGDAEVALLGDLVAAGVAIFFILTPGVDGTWELDKRGPADLPPDQRWAADGAAPEQSHDPVAAALTAHGAVVADALPQLAEAPWFPLDPATADTAYLRRALVEWAGAEALRRASDNPPVLPGAGRTVRVAADAGQSGWVDRLEALTRSSAQLVRQRLAIELANVHLRCVQEIVFGAGCAGLPRALDREMEALSLVAVAECDVAVDRIIDEVLELVLAEPATEAARHRVATATQEGFAEDQLAAELDRVLLVTNTGGVAAVAGAGAVAALAAYHTAGSQRPGTAGVSRPVLPAMGVGLSGACYLHWQHQTNQDKNRARSWLQLAIRGIELELLREISRRFDAVQRSLHGVVSDAIDHGILLS